MPSEFSIDLSKNAGDASTGAYVFRAINLMSSGTKLDWEDRQRFDDLIEFLESARRAAGPNVRQQRRIKLMAARNDPRAIDLPSSDEDIRARDLLGQVLGKATGSDESEAEPGAVVIAFVDQLLPAVEKLAKQGSLEALEQAEREAVQTRLRRVSYALAHINDDALEYRRSAYRPTSNGLTSRTGPAR